MTPDCALEDAVLLAACREEAATSGGPGGQHANRNATAVRLVHRATGLTTVGGDHRERSRNRADALARLRLRLALEQRGGADPAWLEPFRRGQRLIAAPSNPAWPRVVAVLLDAFAAAGASPAAAARALGLSTSQVVRCLGQDKAVVAVVQRLRAVAGRAPVRW